MFRNRFIAGALALGVLALPSAAFAGHDHGLYNYAVFPDGHWIGHGTLTVTHAGSAAQTEEDGSFSFDLLVRKGVASGTLAEEISGTVTSAHAVAKLQGVSAGSGYTLGGSGGNVKVTGTMVFTGDITGNGRTIPIHTSEPMNGHFAPYDYSCSVASGNLAFPMQGAFSNSTTISGPWTAINVSGNGGKNTIAQSDAWFDTIDKVNEDVEKIKAGELTLTKAQAQALIDQAQVVISGLTSAEKCQGSSHISVEGETFLKQFEDNEQYLRTQMKLGDFK